MMNGMSTMLRFRVNCCISSWLFYMAVKTPGNKYVIGLAIFQFFFQNNCYNCLFHMYNIF